jgi:hypothetical protein
VAERRKSSRRVVTVVTLWIVVMAAVGFASGCYGRNCDGSTLVFGHDPGEGRLVSPDKWESNPIDGIWLDFPKQRAWIFDLHDLGDRVPQSITPYVSAQADPNHEPGGNFALAAGNLAEISGVQNDQVIIHNGTCADYFLYLTVEAAPRAPTSSTPSTDSGASP